MAMDEVKNVVSVACRLGSGNKMHVSVAAVKEEIKFGRKMDAYAIDSVSCGAAKRSGWFTSGQWGIQEISERHMMVNEFLAIWNWQRSQAQNNLSKMQELYGDAFCAKCMKQLVSQIERQAQ